MPPNHGDYLLAGPEFATGALIDNTGCLDAEYAGKRDALREAEAGVQFRPVESERLTLMRTQPGGAVGIGTSRIRKASGGPGASRTIARMVPGI